MAVLTQKKTGDYYSESINNLSMMKVIVGNKGYPLSVTDLQTIYSSINSLAQSLKQDNIQTKRANIQEMQESLMANLKDLTLEDGVHRALQIITMLENTSSGVSILEEIEHIDLFNPETPAFVIAMILNSARQSIAYRHINKIVSTITEIATPEKINLFLTNLLNAELAQKDVRPPIDNESLTALFASCFINNQLKKCPSIALNENLSSEDGRSSKFEDDEELDFGLSDYQYRKKPPINFDDLPNFDASEVFQDITDELVTILEGIRLFSEDLYLRFLKEIAINIDSKFGTQTTGTKELLRTLHTLFKKDINPDSIREETINLLSQNSEMKKVLLLTDSSTSLENENKDKDEDKDEDSDDIL